MAVGLPESSVHFCGRTELAARFRARVDYFPLSLFEGLAGSGKTTFMLEMLPYLKKVGIKSGIYLALSPEENVTSLIARIESRLSTKRRLAGDGFTNPLVRLIELLQANRLALVLDDVHYLRKDELSGMVRGLGQVEKPAFRVLLGFTGQSDVSAIDRMKMHVDALGPFDAAEVAAVLKGASIPSAAAAILREDAGRGGMSCHPLTLRYLMTLCMQSTPAAEFFAGKSARSVYGFRAVLESLRVTLPAPEWACLQDLARTARPIAKTTASTVFGASISNLIKRGLVDVVDGLVLPHALLCQFLKSERPWPVGKAKQLAGYFGKVGVSQSEPQAIIRAAEILAEAGAGEEALETLVEGWDASKQLDFLESFLKALSRISVGEHLESRRRLLSARARMGRGHPEALLAEMQTLTEDTKDQVNDPWTREHALSALAFIQHECGHYDAVVTTYERLRKLSKAPDLAFDAGLLAGKALLRVGKLLQAEELARALLKQLKTRPALDRQAEVHRLLAHTLAQSDRLADAIKEARLSAEAFVKSDDVYHGAMAYGYLGDLERESGDFDVAGLAFKMFLELATKSQNGDLIQVAQLAEAWISLDIGDVAHAAKLIEVVEDKMSAAASSRLRRYLAAARALLEAGQSHHDVAAGLLAKAASAWESSGHPAIADMLTAQRVRSLMACGHWDEASTIVEETLKRLRQRQGHVRQATFLRESALIWLHKGEQARAMKELQTAREIFKKSGNRREEANTLHRLARAALEHRDLDLAGKLAKEALALGKQIKHSRATALSREVLAHTAFAKGEYDSAISSSKAALLELRRLGDDLGQVHVELLYLRACLRGGDLTAVIRAGNKTQERAKVLDLKDVRLQAMAYTAAAMIRRGRFSAAEKYAKKLAPGVGSALTQAVMWRVSEGLAVATDKADEAKFCREHWLSAVSGLGRDERARVVEELEALLMPPQERYVLRQSGKETRLSPERLALQNLKESELLVHVPAQLLIKNGQVVKTNGEPAHRLLFGLVARMPSAWAWPEASQALLGGARKDQVEKVKHAVSGVRELLKGTALLSVRSTKAGAQLVAKDKCTVVLPAVDASLLPDEERVLQLFRRFSTLTLLRVQALLGVQRGPARKLVEGLARRKVLTTVKDGRSQAYHLA